APSSPAAGTMAASRHHGRISPRNFWPGVIGWVARKARMAGAFAPARKPAQGITMATPFVFQRGLARATRAAATRPVANRTDSPRRLKTSARRNIRSAVQRCAGWRAEKTLDREPTALPRAG